MKHLAWLCLLLAAIWPSNNTYAQQARPQSQNRVVLDQNSIVKDSSGMEYPYIVWQKMYATGDYGVKLLNKEGSKPVFLIYQLSQQEKEVRAARTPKPRESGSFTTGSTIDNFKESDIEGTKWNLKALRGKVVILNFWFIDCKPCRMEIPELNQLVEEYKTDSSVVFLSFCLDEKGSIKDFLKTTPFNYKIIDNAKYIADDYKVRSYPTHVVVDKEGKVQFHTSGLGPGTLPWLKKSIEALTKKQG